VFSTSVLGNRRLFSPAGRRFIVVASCCARYRAFPSTFLCLSLCPPLHSACKQIPLCVCTAFPPQPDPARVQSDTVPTPPTRPPPEITTLPLPSPWDRVAPRSTNQFRDPLRFPSRKNDPFLFDSHPVSSITPSRFLTWLSGFFQFRCPTLPPPF